MSEAQFEVAPCIYCGCPDSHPCFPPDSVTAVCDDYPAIMTVFAAQGINMNLEWWESARSTLYTCLLGNVGDGKSRTMDRAEATLSSLGTNQIKKTVPGSDRGLLAMFAPPKTKKGEVPVERQLKSWLLLQDELKSLLAKVAIQNSALAPTLCTLWYKDEDGNATSDGVSEVELRLNILGGLKCKDEEEFAKLFSVNTTGGLYDRFVFGVGQSGWDFDDEWFPVAEFRRPVQVSMGKKGSPAFDLLTAWKKDSVVDIAGNTRPKHHGRLAELAQRVALITASANGDKVMTVECMASALAFAEWQEAIRGVYCPGDSESKEGDCTAAILRKIEKLRDSDGKPLLFSWNRMYKDTSWNKTYGPELCRRMRAGLVAMGTLFEELTDSEPGDNKKKEKEGGKSTGQYRLID